MCVYMARGCQYRCQVTSVQIGCTCREDLRWLGRAASRCEPQLNSQPAQPSLLPERRRVLRVQRLPTLLVRFGRWQLGFDLGAAHLDAAEPGSVTGRALPVECFPTLLVSL